LRGEKFMSNVRSAIKVGFLATLAMEIFLRITDQIFNHQVNFAWLNGTSLGLNPMSPLTLIPGYLIFLFGGIAFAYLYQRFVTKKTVLTGILFAVLFAMTVVAGLVVMPITGLTHPLVKAGVIPNPGFFGLGFGMIAGTFNFLAHVIYGALLGFLSKEKN
jgi:hypothetical protein